VNCGRGGWGDGAKTILTGRGAIAGVVGVWGRAGARFGCEEDRGVWRVDVCSSKQLRSIA